MTLRLEGDRHWIRPTTDPRDTVKWLEGHGLRASVIAWFPTPTVMYSPKGGTPVTMVVLGDLLTWNSHENRVDVTT